MCVYSLVVVQHAMRMRHIVICGLHCSTVFSHIISLTVSFRKKVTELKMRVLISSTTIVGNISHSKKNWARYDKNIHWSSCKVPVILARFQWNLNFLRQNFEKKNSITKFHENPSTGSRVVPCGQTDGPTDMTKLIAFRNFAKASKNIRSAHGFIYVLALYLKTSLISLCNTNLFTQRDLFTARYDLSTLMQFGLVFSVFT
jgi:hypothetical protein